ncbi:MAG: ABC transporter ATP-binding protein [Candidatus Brocadiales bacterium]|nr:ABC transporter ATP-binding protein [Candidatus Brocadiales bacterium]
MNNKKKIVQIKNLKVVYKSLLEEVEAVAGIDIDLYAGEALGIVGESGSGKSTVAYSLMGLHDRKRVTVEGEILYNGRNILKNTTSQWQDLRGKEISMIFQNPMSSLTPYLTIGKQVMEPILRHTSKSVVTARKEAIDLLEEVEISDAEKSFYSYPHQLSGGMKQRVMIASAVSAQPKILIADEPSTALDVIIQAKVLRLMKKELVKRGMSLVFITHDLSVVAGLCDRVVVMYQGKVVESATVKKLFAEPEHEYTKKLLSAVPRVDKKVDLPVANEQNNNREENDVSIKSSSINETIISIKDLHVEFAKRKGIFSSHKEITKAVNGVSLELYKGEVLGLVGQSGSGKSTLIRSIAGLVKSKSGAIYYDNKDILQADQYELRGIRRKIQMIFQDPYGSLNPRFVAGRIIAEPLINYGLMSSRDAFKKVRELMELVQLDPAWINRYPHEFSGGQRQRISIARALALEPEILLCDEPVSALDVLIQADVLNLLKEIRSRMDLTMLFVSHDLAVVRYIADRVAVMNKGEIVELKPAADIYSKAEHPYTQQLLDAIPIPDPSIEEKRISC